MKQLIKLNLNGWNELNKVELIKTKSILDGDFDTAMIDSQFLFGVHMSIGLPALFC